MSIINPANPLKKNGGAGVVNWENINGRPDLSDVSSMKTAPIVLTSILWNDSNRQTVPVEGVLADEEQQLAIVKPKRASRALYHSCGIELIDQDDGFLIFECETVPDEDVSVNAFIIGAAEVGEEYTGEFVWWSPQMTSDTTPAPYVCSASSASVGAAYLAFDDDINYTYWQAADNDTSSSISLDCGKQIIVKGIRLFPIKNYLSMMPYSGRIQGSNDGYTWYDILVFENLPNPTLLSYREHIFDKVVRYRHYRIYDMQAHYGFCGIDNIQFKVLEGSV